MSRAALLLAAALPVSVLAQTGEPTEQPTRAPILVGTPVIAPVTPLPATPVTATSPGASPVASETPVGVATPSGEIPDATPTPTAGREAVALEPGADKGLVLPAYGGDPTTALGNEANFLAQTPLRRAWFLREYYRQRGDEPHMIQATEVLLELRLDAGLENATAIAAALAAEARAALKEGKTNEAVAAAEAATKIAPDYPSAWTTLGRAQLGARKIGDAFDAFRGAIGATTGNLRARMRLLGNGGLALIAGAYLAFAIFLLTAYIRHARFLIHDFKHALADNMPAFLAALILLPFLIFPLVFGAGPFALLAWWSVVLWVKMSWRERIVTAIFLAFGAASPILLEKTATSFAFEGGDAGRLFSLVREDELSPRDFQELTATAEESGDADLVLTLAVAHQRAGRYSKARELYEKAKASGAGSAAWIGLGSVHYALGELPEAIAAFEKAVGEGSTPLQAHFNLSQLHAERTDLAKATAELELAKRVDAEACERFTRKMLPPARKSVNTPGAAPLVAAAYTNRFLMSAPISDAAILKRATKNSAVIAERSWRAFSPSIPLSAVTWIFGAALVVAAGLSIAFMGAIPSRPCPKCGRSLCLRCDGPPLDGDICSQCFHAFVQNEGVDPKQRTAKELEIMRNQNRRSWRRKWFSVVVPGTGQIVVGETVKGFILLLLASLLAMRLVFWRGWFRPAFPVPNAWTPILAAILTAVALLVVWYLGARTPREERGR